MLVIIDGGNCVLLPIEHDLSLHSRYCGAKSILLRSVRFHGGPPDGFRALMSIEVAKLLFWE